MNQLIQHLLDNPIRKEKWSELAIKFNINPNQKNKHRRGDTARQMWNDFVKRITNKGYTLETVKEVYKNGELIYETRKRVPSELPEIDYTQFDIDKVTTNPHGGKWIKYKKQLGFSKEQVVELANSFNFEPFKVREIKGTGIGVVDVADIHTGAVVKAFYETVKQRDFNSEVLTHYLDYAVNIINSYGFKEVHLMMPGDIIESFSGFNHRDTYKNIESHQNEVVILSYQILKRLFSNINNIKKVYMVEGNHDRITPQKDSNSRKGVVEILAYFLNENGNIPVEYHPFMLGTEIDGMYHLCTHGDFKPQKNSGYDSFFFKYGKQGMYNVLRTGHYHNFNVLQQTPEYLHYQCPSIYTGGLFEESIGYHSVPAITITQNVNGIASIDYRPLIGYDKGN